MQLTDKIGALEANIGKVSKEAEGLAATHKEELHKERSAVKAAQAQLDGVKAEHAAALQRSENAKVCPCAAATSCCHRSIILCGDAQCHRTRWFLTHSPTFPADLATDTAACQASHTRLRLPMLCLLLPALQLL